MITVVVFAYIWLGCLMGLVLYWLDRMFDVVRVDIAQRPTFPIIVFGLWPVSLLIIIIILLMKLNYQLYIDWIKPDSYETASSED